MCGILCGEREGWDRKRGEEGMEVEREGDGNTEFQMMINSSS